MRKMFSVLFLCLLTGVSFTPCFAQNKNVAAQQNQTTDIIVMKNSTRVDAIITEVLEDVIRYRKASNPNGPVTVAKLTTSRLVLEASYEGHLAFRYTFSRE